MTEFAPAIRTNTAIVLALAERSCSRGAIVHATRFHVPQLSSTRGSPRPLCRIRTSALPSPSQRCSVLSPEPVQDFVAQLRPAISIEGDDFGCASAARAGRRRYHSGSFGCWRRSRTSIAALAPAISDKDPGSIVSSSSIWSTVWSMRAISLARNSSSVTRLAYTRLPCRNATEM